MRGMQPDDVYRLTGAGDPRLSPDGATVAYVAVVGRRGEARADGAPSGRVPADGSAPPRRLTFGGHRDGSPRWSPDGRWLAFTSARGDDPAQLFVLPVDGPGESRQLTAAAEARSRASTWSPDSVAARLRRPRPRSGRRHRATSRSVRRVGSRGCSSGWTTRGGRRVGRITCTPSASTGRSPCSSPTATRRTRCRHGRPTAPRSRSSSARHAGLGPRDRVRHLHDRRARRRAGARHRRPTARASLPVWSPEGDRIAHVFIPGEFDDPRHGRIAVVDARIRRLAPS